MLNKRSEFGRLSQLKNKTIAVFEFMVETKGFVGLALTPLIKLKIAKAAGELAQELKP